jgi:hypothetical protein
MTSQIIQVGETPAEDFNPEQDHIYERVGVQWPGGRITWIPALGGTSSPLGPLSVHDVESPERRARLQSRFLRYLEAVGVNPRPTDILSFVTRLEKVRFTDTNPLPDAMDFRPEYRKDNS